MSQLSLLLICLEFRIGEYKARGVCLRSLVHREAGRRRLGALGAPQLRISQCFGMESTLGTVLKVSPGTCLGIKENESSLGSSVAQPHPEKSIRVSPDYAICNFLKS